MTKKIKVDVSDMFALQSIYDMLAYQANDDKLKEIALKASKICSMYINEKTNRMLARENYSNSYNEYVQYRDAADSIKNVREKLIQDVKCLSIKYMIKE